MPGAVLVTLKIYLLAAAISLAVAAVIKLIGLLMAARAEPRVAPAAAPAAPYLRAGAVTEAEVAAISAAVHAVIGGHRILHIADRSRHEAWAHEGRTAHHGSHDVPRHGAPATPPKPRR